MPNRKQKQPCAALAEVIRPKLPFAMGAGDSIPPYPFIELDLSPLLVLLMQRLTDDAADDDGIIWDFCESFRLDRRAVAAAVRACRLALSATVH